MKHIDHAKYVIHGYCKGSTEGYDDETTAETLKEAKERARYMMTEEHTRIVESTVPVVYVTIQKYDSDDILLDFGNDPSNESDGDHFSFENGRLTFRTQSLSTFMALEIATIPAERFKRCANYGHGCRSPYFFASDLRERYCSETCAHESKKRAKLKWWNDNRKKR